MNTVPMFCLIAVFAGPLHAQVCSGGAQGGMDATGNQCSDASTVGVHENASNIASSGPTAKMSGNQQSTAATVVTLLATKVSGAAATPVVSAQGASRFAKAAPPPSAPVKTSKIETVENAPSCAGTMDATGNECAESPVAVMNTGRIVARP